MKGLKTEWFQCPKCQTIREIMSIGHAVTVPCKNCGKPMKFINSERSGGHKRVGNRSYFAQ